MAIAVSPYSGFYWFFSRVVYDDGGRIVLVQPLTQMVLLIVACVTSRLNAPGVQRTSALPLRGVQVCAPPMPPLLLRARTTVARSDVVARVLDPGTERALVFAPRPSLVDPFESFIDDTLKAHPRLRATRLYDMTRMRGYDGGIAILRRHVAAVRPIPRGEVYLRVERLIGEQAHGASSAMASGGLRSLAEPSPAIGVRAGRTSRSASERGERATGERNHRAPVVAPRLHAPAPGEAPRSCQ